MLANKKFIKLAKKIIKKNNLPVWFLEEPFFYRTADVRRIRSLKNKYKGMRCFIVGNGPTLNNHDLNKISKEYSFAVNGIFYKTDECGYKPTFYVVEDTSVMEENINRINELEVEHKFFPINYKHLANKDKNTFFFKMNTGYYLPESPHYCVPRFSADMSARLYCGQSVTMINLQIAYYLGFSEVFLIGMDFSYNIPDSAVVNGDCILSTEDDENHFHPDYFGKGKTWHDPHLDRVLNSYQLMKLMYEIDERKIYNATIGGRLELFDRVDYDTLFS